MGAAGVAVPWILAGISAGAAVYSGVATKRAADAEVENANQNRILSLAAARDAEARGQVAESRKREETLQRIGRARVAAAASGLDIQTGSPLDIISATGDVGELEAQDIRLNAARERWGFEQQAADFGRQARYAKKAGRRAMRASYLSAALSFAGTYGTAGGSFSYLGKLKGPG